MEFFLLKLQLNLELFQCVYEIRIELAIVGAEFYENV